MKNQETGEFELVLGNRQLLSGFFVVVVLFGVFFVMGYIVGRNSAPSPRMAAGVENLNPTGRPQPLAGSVPAAPPAAEAPKPAEAGAAETPPPQPTTQPAREAGAPAPQAAVAPATQSLPAAEPAAGETYLQVMAVKRPEAEVVLKTLRDKGYPALLGTGPNELVRVLVGPFSDAATLGQAKAQLENAGFHPIVRK